MLFQFVVFDRVNREYEFLREQTKIVFSFCCRRSYNNCDARHTLNFVERAIVVVNKRRRR